MGDLLIGRLGVPSAPPSPVRAPRILVVRPMSPAGPVYPYSIVPGGISGADQALRAAETDPHVANHYVGVNLSALSLAVAERPRAVHVSYRVGDRVFWTRQKLNLRPGELLLSDGSEVLRARCGNRVSDEPREPVADDEPPPEVFDTPVPTAGVLQADPAPLEARQLVPNEVPVGFAAAPDMPPFRAIPPGGVFGIPGGVAGPDGGPRFAPPTPGDPPVGDPPVGDPPAGDPPMGDPPIPPTPDAPVPPDPRGGVPPLPPGLPATPPTASVPEPGTLLLVAGGLAALALRRRRDR